MNNILEQLQANGYVILKQAADIKKLDKLKEEFDIAYNSKKFGSVNDERFKYIYDPFITCPTTADLIMDNNILDIIKQYLGVIKFGPPNLKKSLITKLPPSGTNLFHSDRNCGIGVSILKCFYYLHDVDEDGGPFEFIEGSHTNKWIGWENPKRRTDSDIYNRYGKDKSRILTAKYGDIIIADTTGFHRGIQSKNKERIMYTPLFLNKNYVSPNNNEADPFKIRRSSLCGHEEYAEHLKIID